MKQLLLSVIFIGVIVALNAQNVGIGTNTPNPSAQLEIASSNKGVLLPRMSSFSRTLIFNPANGLMVYDTTVNRLYQYQDGAWRYLINNTYWLQSSSRNFVYNSTDSVGIGTASPSQRLDVNGNIRSRDDVLADGRVVATGLVTGGGFSTAGGLTVASSGLIGGDFTANGNISTNSELSINSVGATFQLKNGSAVNKGFFQLSGDDVRFGTNSGNSLGNVIVRMNGNNRFTFSESGRMTLSADLNPTIHFNSAGTPKALLQVQGDDLTISAPGNTVRISNVLYVDDATNRVGIGTSSPTERLHVSGNTLITGTTTLNGSVTLNAPMVSYSKARLYQLEVYGGQVTNLGAMAVGPNSFAEGLYSSAIGENMLTASGTENTFGIGTNAAVSCNGCAVLTDGQLSAGARLINSGVNHRMIMRFLNGFRLYTEVGSGVDLLRGSNSWSSLSDSTKKENYKEVKGSEFLRKIAAMKLGSWNYKSQDKSNRHYGPMAQEFFANFGNDGIGIIGNDTTIATADIDGVIMIALQALVKENELLKRESKDRQSEIKQLREAEKALLERMNKIEAILSKGNNSKLK